MGAGVVVWALPGDWDTYELDSAEAEEQLEARVRRQWEGFSLDEPAEGQVFFRLFTPMGIALFGRLQLQFVVG